VPAQPNRPAHILPKDIEGGGAGTCLLKQASQGGAEGGGGGLRDATGEGCGALFRPEDMARYVVVVQLVVPW
jgi:hypothetical protein